MISGYIETSRLEKARETKDIEIIESSTDKIVAGIYEVILFYIDLEKRFILHDCEDGRRTERKALLQAYRRFDACAARICGEMCA
ncbi:MAG TPA: hypothetical protein VN368_02545 [Candidatus Methylomirabilis sp.]|nr:hypothetical protein [Candidatus Methylomirabilis sp.]